MREVNKSVSFGICASAGVRNIACGGVSNFFDFDGDDKYFAEQFSICVSTWFSCSGFIDAAGDDVYWGGNL